LNSMRYTVLYKLVTLPTEFTFALMKELGVTFYSFVVTLPTKGSDQNFSPLQFIQNRLHSGELYI